MFLCLTAVFEKGCFKLSPLERGTDQRTEFTCQARASNLQCKLLQDTCISIFSNVRLKRLHPSYTGGLCFGLYSELVWNCNFIIKFMHRLHNAKITKFMHRLHNQITNSSVTKRTRFYSALQILRIIQDILL